MRLNEEVARRLEVLRVARGVSTDDIETHFMLSEGWWALIKSGDWPLGIDFVAAVLQYLDGTIDDELGGVDLGTEPFEMTRRLSVTTEGRDLVLHFPYGEHRATYRLPSAARAEFERWSAFSGRKWLSASQTRLQMAFSQQRAFGHAPTQLTCGTSSSTTHTAIP